MSPLTDAARVADIRQRNTEKFRIANLPRINPETGRENPFVLIDQNDRDIAFLLTQISALQDEIQVLEELVEQDETFDDNEDTPTIN